MWDLTLLVRLNTILWFFILSPVDYKFGILEYCHQLAVDKLFPLV